MTQFKLFHLHTYKSHFRKGNNIFFLIFSFQAKARLADQANSKAADLDADQAKKNRDALLERRRETARRFSRMGSRRSVTGNAEKQAKTMEDLSIDLKHMRAQKRRLKERFHEFKESFGVFGRFRRNFGKENGSIEKEANEKA